MTPSAPPSGREWRDEGIDERPGCRSGWSSLQPPNTIQVVEDPDGARRLAEQAAALLAERHSAASFAAALRAFPGYVGSGDKRV